MCEFLFKHRFVFDLYDQSGVGGGAGHAAVLEFEVM